MLGRGPRGQRIFLLGRGGRGIPLGGGRCGRLGLGVGLSCGLFRSETFFGWKLFSMKGAELEGENSGEVEYSRGAGNSSMLMLICVFRPGSWRRRAWFFVRPQLHYC